jgi:hypothetical protein
LKSLADLIRDISSSEIISLAYDDPRIKLSMVQSIVEECLGSTQLQYIDFDLQFSSMLQNGDRKYNENLQLFQPGPSVLDFVVPMLKTAKLGGLVIVDTLNTVQNLFSLEPTPSDIKAANHRSAVLVSALQLLARSYSKTLILLNLTKQRPRKKADSTVTWERDIIGGRMTRFKSDAILFASEHPTSQGSIKVRVAVTSNSFKGKAGDEYEIVASKKSEKPIHLL